VTRILVIDDDIDVREQVMRTLLMAFFEATTASNGQDGVAKALENPPDLIICDMMMPIMDGQQVLAELRQHPETASTPFIFLTAVDSRQTVRQSMNLGADDYLFKPIQVDDLLNAVTARLKHRQQVVADVEQQLEGLKMRMARTITHELRTPLVSIVQALDVLSRQADQLPEDMYPLLDSMHYGAHRLNHCIEQMVFAMQITTGVLTQEKIGEGGFPTSLKDILHTAVQMAQRFAVNVPPEVSVKVFETADDPFVHSNTVALKHAFAEIIANAMVFSPAKGVVKIGYKRSGEEVRVAVTDSGDGIPHDELEQAMSWFAQIGRDIAEQQGMGLGLPLASQLVAIHNGSLDVRSIVGKGTQVIITLPTVQPA
jgi:two-component system, sensor histidine kinase and response regulator